MLKIYTSENLNPTVLELDLRADIYFILRPTTRASGMEIPPPPFFVTFCLHVYFQQNSTNLICHRRSLHGITTLPLFLLYVYIIIFNKNSLLFHLLFLYLSYSYPYIQTIVW